MSGTQATPAGLATPDTDPLPIYVVTNQDSGKAYRLPYHAILAVRLAEPPGGAWKVRSSDPQRLTPASDPVCPDPAAAAAVLRRDYGLSADEAQLLANSETCRSAEPLTSVVFYGLDLGTVMVSGHLTCNSAPCPSGLAADFHVTLTIAGT